MYLIVPLLLAIILIVFIARRLLPYSSEMLHEKSGISSLESHTWWRGDNGMKVLLLCIMVDPSDGSIMVNVEDLITGKIASLDSDKFLKNYRRIKCG